MNCKQGDLAIVVDAPPYAQEFLGRIYTCVSLTASDLNKPAWKVDGNTTSKHGLIVKCIEDMFLKPLDAPLDDDEVINEKELTCTD